MSNPSTIWGQLSLPLSPVGAIPFVSTDTVSILTDVLNLWYDSVGLMLNVNNMYVANTLIIGDSRVAVPQSNAIASTPILQIQQLNATNQGPADVGLVRWNSRSTLGPTVFFTASRATAITLFSAVVAGDGLGQISFGGDDGSSLVTNGGASINAIVDGAVSTHAVPARIEIRTASAGFDTTANIPPRRMYIDSLGNTVIAGNSASTLGTGAINGFMHIPIMGGSPSTAPAQISIGNTPFIYDTVNHKLWTYDWSAVAWKGVAVA